MITPSELHSPPGFVAALWDMDGTLVDTEPYWMRAQIELMQAHGLGWTEVDGELMVGNTLLRSAEILREHGLDVPAEIIVDILLARVIAVVETEGVPFRPGAQELLADLRSHGIPCALVTMSYRSLAESVVQQCAPHSFDILITGDEVNAGKPDPEAYLTAARALNVDPGECVSFEDSVPGLTSALAAGTQAVGIPHCVSLAEFDSSCLLPTLAGHTTDSIAKLLRSR